jgi:hypothetical protein
MTECCCPFSSNKENETRWQRLCPQDGTKGKPVQLITLKSLLVPVALEQLNPATTYGFCPSPNCQVVYFSEQRQTFTTADLKVSVFQKNVNEDVPALLHKYLKPLRGKDRQLKALIDKTLYDKAFRRKAESLCNNAGCSCLLLFWLESPTHS